MARASKQAPPPPVARPVIDWERIELEYRAGVLSTREIGGIHGISHTAINKRSKAHGWNRDLSAKIHAKAEALVSREAVSTLVSSGNDVSERVLIEANAMVIAQIRSQHRGDSGRARGLCLALLAELEAQTSDPEGLAKLGEMLRAPNEFGMDKLNDIYRAVISLPERTKTMKALVESLKHLFTMEREAYGIAATGPLGDTPAVETIEIPDDPVEASRAYQKLMARVS